MRALHFRRFALFLPVCALLGVGDAAGQAAPLDISRFADADDWPLYEPGTFPLDTVTLGTQRTLFHNLAPDGRTFPMILDVIDVSFQGGPAYWIQYTSRGLPGDSGAGANIDALLVDGTTFRVAYRMAAQPGDRTWAGAYRFTQHHPDKVVQVLLSDSGTVEREVHVDSLSTFDFATLGYLFPFVSSLEPGRTFRLKNIGRPGDLAPAIVSIHVKGRTTIEDADGATHEVWEVELLSQSRALLVTFYVGESAPFWYGWVFRRVSDGQVVSRLEYVGPV